MATKRIPYLILLFGLFLTPSLFIGCEIFCDCEDEIEATYGHFGEPDEIFSESTDEKHELTLRYVSRGFEKVFVWGDRESRYCCLESTKSITEDDPDDPDEPDGPEDPDEPDDPDSPDDPDVPDDPNDPDDPENPEEPEENSKPWALNQTVYPHVSESKEIELTAGDADRDPLTYRIEEQPENGNLNQLENNHGIFTYTSNVGLSDGDIDQFTFVANDGQVDSNVAAVKIILGNQVPEAKDVEVEITVNPGNELSIQLDGSDANGDTLTYEIVDFSGIINGLLETGELDEETGRIPYIQGVDSYEEEFTYKVTDSMGEVSNIGTVTVLVREP